MSASQAREPSKHVTVICDRRRGNVIISFGYYTACLYADDKQAVLFFGQK